MSLGLGSSQLIGSNGAPATSSYIVINTDGTLTNERALAGTTNQIILTDGGVGGTLTLSLPQSIHTAATPQFAGLGLGMAWASGVLIKTSATSGLAGQFRAYTVAPILEGQRGNNTEAAPHRAQSGEALFTLRAGGFWNATAATGGSTEVTNKANIRFVAKNDWDGASNLGTQIEFGTTATGSGTVATCATLTNTALTLASGVSLNNTTGQDIRPDTSNGYARFVTGTQSAGTPSGGTGVNQMLLNLYAKADTASYFNPVITFNAYDGTNLGAAFEIGTEGGWTNGGGFTSDKRLYAWDYALNGGTGASIWYYDHYNPTQFNIGDSKVQMDLKTMLGNVEGRWYANSTVGPAFIGRKLRGTTFTNGRRAQSGDTLVTFDGTGAFAADDVSTPDWTAGAAARILMQATAAFTSTSRPTQMLFQLTPSGSTTLSTVATVGPTTWAFSNAITAVTAAFTANGANTLDIGSPTQANGAVNILANSVSTLTLQRISSDTSAPGLNQYKARGSGTGSEAAINAADVFFNLAGLGYDAATTGQAWPTTAGVQIRGLATQTFSTTAHGSRLELRATPTDSTTIANKLLLGCDKALTDNTATSVLSCTIANNTTAGGVITYTIEATDGTDYQVETGQVVWSAVNKAGTVTATVTEINSQQNVSAGTLTTAWTISAANPAVISVNADTSLTPSAGYPRITFNVSNTGRQSVVTT